MFGLVSRRAGFLSQRSLSNFRRCLTTLNSNKHLYVFPNPSNQSSKVITFLPTDPPTLSLAAGESDQIPPHPQSFRENHKFLTVLNAVIAEHAHADPQIKSQAAAMASEAGSSISQVNRRTTTGSAGASDQGGAGSGGVGGWIHVYDNRHPPDFGRIPDPEDIFGSLEVDSNGQFTDGTGHYQASGTYRICTNDGILELPDYLRGKLLERLKVEEAAIKNKK